MTQSNVGIHITVQCCNVPCRLAHTLQVPLSGTVPPNSAVAGISLLISAHRSTEGVPISLTLLTLFVKIRVLKLWKQHIVKARA